MNSLLKTLSDSSGKHGAVEAAVFDTNGEEDALMEAYLHAREAENSDPNRRHYSLTGGHNCGTLICDALSFAGRPAPADEFRTPGVIFGYFAQLQKYFGVTQEFTCTPQKEEVNSKFKPVKRRKDDLR